MTTTIQHLAPQKSPLIQVKTTCAYCGVGCGVLATIDENTQHVSIDGDPTHPANFGKLCSKGKALGDTLDRDRRLAHPMIHGEAVDWDTATDFVAKSLQQTIDEYGADSVMLYVSGQLLTEDYYVANKFTKGFLGTNNLDSNSRLCMSSAVAGYKRAFGSDTVPCNYEDIENSDLFIIIGSNMAWCHPILFGRLKSSKQANANKKIVVIDPRATDSTAIADLHLPIRSGTDTHLFVGLLNYLHQNGYANHDYLRHCDNLADALAASDSWTIKKVAKICGVNESDLTEFYQLFATTTKTVSFYSMGVNQASNGTDKVNSIINCHLYTGKLGFEGAGAFSITGQPNAMGGREVGALANLLASHFELKNSDHRQTVANFWQAPTSISGKDGIKATQCADAILEGQIKAIWIMATNPVVSLPEADKFAMALQQCPLVIVSDCSKDSDTLDFAHVALPAQGWSEKSGTVTNSERRISRQRRLVTPFADAKPDWWIVSQVAQKMGFVGFDYTHDYQVFAEHARLSGEKNGGEKNTDSRSFNISHLANISQNEYDNLAPFQWGQPHYFGLQKQDAHTTIGTTYTDTQKLHFVTVNPAVPKSLPDEQYPLVLNTGRSRDQWHTMTRTGIAPQLNQHLPHPLVAIHPSDAKPLGVQNNDFVQINSPNGTILVRADVTEKQRQGDVFIPMHWNQHFAANARVGKLISNHHDPFSQQPQLKHQPVRLQKLTMQAFGWLLIDKHCDENLLTWLESPDMTYWVRNRQSNSSQYFFAIDNQSAFMTTWFDKQYWQQQLSVWLNQPAQAYNFDIIHYQHIDTDNTSQDLRLAILQNGQVHALVFLSTHEHKLPTHNWLDSQFGTTLDSHTRKWLLMGKPATGFIDTGRIVCSCMSVGENTIVETIKKYHCKTVVEVGKHCKAGTNCGSCLGEISKILAG